jgi:hypothetical protein
MGCGTQDITQSNPTVPWRKLIIIFHSLLTLGVQLFLQSSANGEPEVGKRRGDARWQTIT